MVEVMYIDNINRHLDKCLLHNIYIMKMNFISITYSYVRESSIFMYLKMRVDIQNLLKLELPICLKLYSDHHFDSRDQLNIGLEVNVMLMQLYFLK